MVAITVKAEIFTCGEIQVKRPLVQFTSAKCSITVKTDNFTCFYAASTSHREKAIACNKACKSQAISPAWFRPTYLEFEGEFARGVIADCLQLRVFLCAIAGIFACDCGWFCRGPLLGQSFAQSGWRSCPLQDDDNSGSRPQSFPILYWMRSGMSQERFRNGPNLAGS